MKYSVYVISILITLKSIAYSAEVKGESFSFDVPDKVEFTAENEPESYSFDWTKSAPPGGMSFFFMAKNPSIEGTNSIPELVKDTLTEITKQMKLQGFDVTSSSKNNCQYGLFYGSEIKFTVQRGEDYSMDLYIFHMWDGNTGWSGQLSTATTNDVDLFRQILKSGKKTIANQGMDLTR